jgi:creatinine amidohydrolase/Fe(II)-dependent formamide hydrolase-like protein
MSQRVRSTVWTVCLTATIAIAQTAGGQRGAGQPPTPPPATFFSTSAPPNLVDFDMMTWPEVYRAIHDQGKTTALVYTGGTEQRGPQNVNGGHTLMGQATVHAIAVKLGNAIAMPVLPYTPNNASASQPGTIGLTPELLSAVLERITDQTIVNGFKNVILMGDHGGGQPATYRDLAAKLDAKYAPEGVHVYFCDEVYAKANGDFDKYLTEHHLPVSTHAGIPDTSEMLYLGGDKGWVRKDLIPIAVGGGGGARGQQPADPNAPRAVATGVSGDGRPSTPELGKMIFDQKVDYAVAQIRRLIAAGK